MIVRELVGRATRARLLLVLAAIALLVVPAATASPGFALRRVDASAYPTIRLVVRSASPSAAPAVLEDGSPVKGLSEENLGASKAIVVAVDRSQSMAGQPLALAAAAADQLVRRKRQSDEVEVVTFGSTALAQTSFSQSTIDADNALGSVSTDPTPGTALYDAVVVSSATLRAQPLPGRVLILLTDGHDVRSLSTLPEALAAARRANVVVYTIALGSAAPGPLRALAAGTGGSFYSSPSAAALQSVYNRISAELDHTWRVSYITSARPGDRISVSVGGAEHALQIPGRSSAPYRSLLPRSLVNGRAGILALAAAVAILLFLAVLLVRALPRSERIKRLVVQHTDDSVTRTGGTRSRPQLSDVVRGLNARLSGVPQLDRVDRMVEAAALPASAATVLVGCGSFGLLVAILTAAATGSAGVAVVFFLFALALPLVGLSILAKRRIRAFEDQLPEVLATIASSLRSGHGLKQSLQAVATDGPPPINTELRRVLSEARLGRPLEESFVSMCERVGSDDLLYVATAVDVQSQVGGSLAGVFDTVATTVRDRQQHRRRVRAVTATGRATATVLALMPFGFVAILLAAAPRYITPFLSSGLGHVLLVFSIISISIGAFLLNRIVSVKA